MSLLPVPSNNETGLTTRQVAKARRAQSSAELTVFRHSLQTRVQAEEDLLDSQALGDASRAALDEEMDLLDHGLRRAGRSTANVELVARRVQLMATINDRRIARRFGR